MSHRENSTQDFENQSNTAPSEAACSDETVGTSQEDILPDNDNVADESFENADKESDLAAQAEEWRDKYIRLSAEFDNYRKRTLKEKADLISLASGDVIKSILVVLDDFDRAQEALLESTDTDALKQGIDLIHTKLIDTLKAKGLQEIEALGKELDTDFHEAIAKIPTEDEAQKGKIIDVVTKGYTLKDKVLRYSKVVVGE